MNIFICLKSAYFFFFCLILHGLLKFLVLMWYSSRWVSEISWERCGASSLSSTIPPAWWGRCLRLLFLSLGFYFWRVEAVITAILWSVREAELHNTGWNNHLTLSSFGGFASGLVSLGLVQKDDLEFTDAHWPSFVIWRNFLSVEWIGWNFIFLLESWISALVCSQVSYVTVVY